MRISRKPAQQLSKNFSQNPQPPNVSSRQLFLQIIARHFSVLQRSPKVLLGFL